MPADNLFPEGGQGFGMLEFVSGGNEVYEVVFLPNTKWPELVSFEELE